MNPETNHNPAQKIDKKKKIIIIAISSIVALLVLLLIGNSIAKSVVRSKLIGKTFEGEYNYYSDYGDTNIEMIVEIIDEKYCNVFFDYEKENMGSTPDEKFQTECYNIPYKLSGGVFGVKFEWIGGTRDPADPFEVRMKKGKVVSMVTYHFNSHRSASLHIVEYSYP